MKGILLTLFYVFTLNKINQYCLWQDFWIRKEMIFDVKVFIFDSSKRITINNIDDCLVQKLNCSSAMAQRNFFSRVAFYTIHWKISQHLQNILLRKVNGSVHVDNNDVTFKTHHRIGMRASTPTIIIITLSVSYMQIWPVTSW